MHARRRLADAKTNASSGETDRAIDNQPAGRRPTVK
jgi:hypothetical protein